MRNTVTPQQKFANYFNLKEDFVVEDVVIDGYTYHEGQEFTFSSEMEPDETLDFDEDYVEKYKEYYTRDIEGANKYLEFAIASERGCYFSYDIKNFKSSIYDSIEEYIGQEAVFEYGAPYIDEEYSALTTKEVA